MIDKRFSKKDNNKQFWFILSDEFCIYIHFYSIDIRKIIITFFCRTGDPLLGKGTIKVTFGDLLDIHCFCSCYIFFLHFFVKIFVLEI